MQAIEKRLRKGDQIVGYLKTIGKSEYYSPDLLWWSGKKIEYDQFDRGLGYQDINAKWLFENDLIRLKTFKPLIQILYDASIDRFMGVDYASQEIIIEDLTEHISRRRSKRISYTFIQQDK